ncbi:MAG: lipocalin family protein [Pseudomonadota bacterium]
MRYLFPALAALTLTACMNQPDYRAEKADPETVPSVDLERYAGLWYEIARYPNFFEDREGFVCFAPTAEYTLRGDGKVGVRNRCRKNSLDGPVEEANGRAWVVDPSGAKLKVQFAPRWIPFTSGDYWVLDLTEDYSAALVGDPTGKYLWILSRTPVLPEETKARILATAEAKGYQTEPFFWPPHLAAE